MNQDMNQDTTPPVNDQTTEYVQLEQHQDMNQDIKKEVIIMNEKDMRMKLIVEELCASAIKIAHAHIDKELDTVMLREAEKFYNMFLMFEATAGTVTPQERPF